MQKKIQKLLAALLVFAMVVGFLPVFDLGIEAKAANDVATDVVYDYVYDISKYRDTNRMIDVSTKISNWSNLNEEKVIKNVYRDYPGKTGYVFAGWYTDIKTKTPLGTDVVSGGAYAKFVPESLIQAVAQVSVLTNHTTPSSALRFIAAVDSLEYNQIGFTVTKVGRGSYIHSSTRVYNSLSAALVNTGEESLRPTYFGEAAEYMYALTVTGIKDQTQGYTAEPFWITNDGTLVDHAEHETAEKTVEMGVNANIAADRQPNPAPKNTDWYDTSKSEYVIKTVEDFIGFVELSKTQNFAGKTIKLAADITFNEDIATDGLMSDTEILEDVDPYTTIGSNSMPFAGTFDGCGHTISGIAVFKGGDYTGVFAVVEGATIKDLTVSRSIFRGGGSGGCSAAIVGKSKGTTTIQNVNVTKDVKLYKATYMGGIVGLNDGELTISNTSSSVAVNPQWITGASIGGIVGANANTAGHTLTLENCLFNGWMNGSVTDEVKKADGSVTYAPNYIGGLIGASLGNPVTTLTDCLSAGLMTINYVVNDPKQTTPYVGSVVGSAAWDGAKSVVTDVYAVAEYAPVCKVEDNNVVPDGSGSYYDVVRADQVGIYFTATKVNLADVMDGLALLNASGLDYEKVWTTVGDGTPELREFSTKAGTAWYDPDATEVIIDTKEELLQFAKISQTNNFEGVTVKLGANITFNEGGNAADWVAGTVPTEVWTPISSADVPFAGTFDGQGHTISGLYIGVTGTPTGLFAFTQGATIKNLTIANSYFGNTGNTANTYNGTLVGKTFGGSISYIHVTNTVYVYNGYRIGGLVAGAYKTSDTTTLNLDNCRVSAQISVSGQGERIGGFIGEIDNTSNNIINFNNCLFDGTISGTTRKDFVSYVGGFASLSTYNATKTVKNSMSAGTITATAASGSTKTTYVGSLFGDAGGKLTLTNVYATTQCHEKAVGSGSVSVTPVSAETFCGDNATTATALDFTSTWKTVDGKTPELVFAAAKNIDTTWYDPNATEYTIMTAGQLNGLASLVNGGNTFENKIIYLGKDISYNTGTASEWANTPPTNTWTSIGVFASKYFSGTFDGQGHTISGLYQNTTNGGLFGDVKDGAVKNLKLTNSYIKCNGTSGVISAGTTAGAEFSNIYVDAIISNADAQVGGIVGRVYGNATTTKPVFTNCTVAGTISGNYVTGGIIALVAAQNSTVVITDCAVTAAVSNTNEYNTDLGGMIGRTDGVSGTITITDCTVSGAITSPGSNVGGILGRAAGTPIGVTISDVAVSSKVQGKSNVGGLIGTTSLTNSQVITANITRAAFTGTIQGTGHMGGLIGDGNNGGVITITDSLVSTTISGGTSNGNYGVGGVIGRNLNSNVLNLTRVLVDVRLDVLLTQNNQIGAISGFKSGTAANFSCSDVYVTTETLDTVNTIMGGRYLTGYYDGTTDRRETVEQRTGANEVTQANVLGTNAASALTNFDFLFLWATHENGLPTPTGAVHEGMDLSWYDADASEYVLMDAEDLMGFHHLANTQKMNFSNKIIRLGANIVLNEGKASDWAETPPANVWTPISTEFKGTFDGQGHSISGLYIKTSGHVGMFYTGNATYKDFNIANCYVESTDARAGALFGYMSGGSATNIHVDGIIKGATHTGGLVGYHAGGTAITIDGCSFNGSVTSTGSAAGGIIGYRQNAGDETISNCTVSGTITGAVNNGGIYGVADNTDGKITIRDCTVNAAISTGDATGGIMGKNICAVEISGCKVTNTASVSGKDKVGGILGYGTASATITSCTVDGAVTGTASNVGGVIGYAQAAVSITDSDVSATISCAGSNSAGIVGYANSSCTGFAVDGCTFSGELTGTGDFTAGVVGFLQCASGTAATISNTEVSGTINGPQNTGGFIGVSHANVTTTISNSAFSGTVSVTGDTAGGFVSYNNGVVNLENCISSGNISGANNVGGFFGTVTKSASITDCTFTGNVTASGIAVGGIAGKTANATTFTNVVADGSVSALAFVGGLVGVEDTNGTNTYTDCQSNGHVTSTGNDGSYTYSPSGLEAIAATGGFVGASKSTQHTFTRCISDGIVEGTGHYIGGFIGFDGNSAINASFADCVFTGIVYSTAGTRLAGFIAGTPFPADGSKTTYSFTNCFATGTVGQNTTGTNYALGVFIGQAFGTASNPMTATFTDCYAVNAKTAYKSAGRYPTNAIGLNQNTCITTASSIKTNTTGNASGYKELLKNGKLTSVREYVNNLGNEVNISTCDDLLDFMYGAYLTDYADKTIKLTENIDINTLEEGQTVADWAVNAPAINWIPVGHDGRAFAGEFDGQGYTISGLYCAHASGHSMGMFREVTGTVTNFKLVNSYFENTVETNYGYNAAIVAYLNGGTVSKVYTDAFVKTVDSYAGGIVGFTAGDENTVDQCQFAGSLLARCTLNDGCPGVTKAADGKTTLPQRGHANYVGGIVGCLTADSTVVTNCLYTGTIIGECNSTGVVRGGGIVGGGTGADKSLTMTGCVSYGNYQTINHTGDSYHYSQLVDLRWAKVETVDNVPTASKGDITVTYASTLHLDNYAVEAEVVEVDGVKTWPNGRQGYLFNGNTVRNGGEHMSMARRNNTNAVSTKYYTPAELYAELETNLANGTSKLNFETVWNYNPGALPTLKWVDGSADSTFTYTETEDDGKLLVIPMDGATVGDFADVTYTTTPAGEKKFSDVTRECYTLEITTEAKTGNFQNIDYGHTGNAGADGVYMTKYVNTDKTAYDAYIAKLEAFGFERYAQSDLNGETYNTTLTLGSLVYTVIHNTNTSCTYVTMAHNMNLSPNLIAQDFSAETVVNENTVLKMLKLSLNGDSYVLQLKNGKFIVFDGGRKANGLDHLPSEDDSDRDALLYFLLENTPSEKDGYENLKDEYKAEMETFLADRSAKMEEIVTKYKSAYNEDITEDTAATLLSNVKAALEADQDNAELKAKKALLEEWTAWYNRPNATDYRGMLSNYPVVDGWFITHGHGDHLGFFADSWGEYNYLLKVNGFYFNQPSDFVIENTQHYYFGTENEGTENETVYRYAGNDTTIEKFYQRNTRYITEDGAVTPVYRPQAGQKYYFNGVTIEVPYSQELITHAEYQLDLNASSTWYLVRMDEGQSFLDSGDTENVNMAHVKSMYSDTYTALYEPTVYSVAHHGLNAYNGTYADPAAKTADFVGADTLLLYTRQSIDDVTLPLTTTGIWIWETVSDTKWMQETKDTNSYLTGYTTDGEDIPANSLNLTYYYYGNGDVTVTFSNSDNTITHSQNSGS